MSPYKNIDLCKDFATDAYLTEAQNPIPPPPLYTQYSVYVYTVYLFTQERGEG
jgi:hypothetical protein